MRVSKSRAGKVGNGRRRSIVAPVMSFVVVALVIGLNGRAAAESSADSIGQVLPEEVPAGLEASLDRMAEVAATQPTSKEWEAFLDSLQADLRELYEGNPSPVKQRDLLARLVQANDRMRRTLAAPGAEAIADELSVLQGRLQRRVAVLTSAEKLLGSTDDKWRDELRDLIGLLEDWEKFGSRADAYDIMQVYRRLAESDDPAARELAQAVNTHYNHYNVRVMVSGRLLDQLTRSRRTESGQLRDYVLGADVHGSQTTTANSRVVLMPNSQAASYIVQVEGRTDTQTQSYPRSEGGGVVIHSRGVSRFTAHRRVDMTAEGIRAGEPVIAVNASNRVIDADTPYSGMLLIGSMGRSTAMGEAEARRPQAEAMAAARVRERVLPQFAAETSERIEAMNIRYQERVVERLKNRNAFPDVLDFSSTSSHVFALGRTAAANELGAYEPQFWIPGDALATLQIHESAINNALARGRLRGDTIDQNSIGKLTAEAEGTEMPEEAEESIISMKLRDDEPLHVSFVDNTVVLEFRTQFLQKKEEKLPNQIVRVRYSIEPLERTLKIVRQGAIELRPIEDAEEKEEKLAPFRDALELIFLNQFEIGLPKIENQQGKQTALSPAEVKMRDGWFSMSVR